MIMVSITLKIDDHTTLNFLRDTSAPPRASRSTSLEKWCQPKSTETRSLLNSKRSHVSKSGL